MTTICPLCRCQSRALDLSAVPAFQRGGDVPVDDGDHVFQFSSYGRAVLTSRVSRRPSVLRVCVGCGERLDGWDVRFAGELSDPSCRRGLDGPLAYDSWLPRYVAALAWSSLVSRLDEGATFRESGVQASALAAIERWRGFAAGEASDAGPFHLHMLPIPPLGDDGDDRSYSSGVVHQRAVISRTGEAWMWMKRPRVLLLGTLTPGVPSALTTSRLEAGAAVWGDEPVHVPGTVRFLMYEEWRRSTHALRYVAAEVPCRA